jgi:hypothetical protein
LGQQQQWGEQQQRGCFGLDGLFLEAQGFQQSVSMVIRTFLDGY